jgi:hypothetical protein
MVARVARALKHASFHALLALPVVIAIAQGARWRP